MAVTETPVRIQSERVALEPQRVPSLHSEAAKRYRDFIEIAADWFWELDGDLRISFVGGNLEGVFGISAEHLLGQHVRKVAANIGLEPLSRAEFIATWERRRPYKNLKLTWTHPNGQARILSHSAKPIFNRSGVFRGYRGVIQDVTEAHQQYRELLYQARHDPLTGLVNRRELERRLQNLVMSARKKSTSHSICLIDLDRFKLVNDSAGHLAGDNLLQKICTLINTLVRPHDTLARLGGDELGLLLENCTPEAALPVAEQIRQRLEACRFHWKQHTFSVSCSIGIAAISAANHTYHEALAAADSACYVAKRGGGNRAHVDRGECALSAKQFR